MNHTSCQFRDKHTVGGIVFYKHAFLVYNSYFTVNVDMSLLLLNLIDHPDISVEFEPLCLTVGIGVSD